MPHSEPRLTVLGMLGEAPLQAGKWNVVDFPSNPALLLHPEP
jgi:hypothetical protein